MNDRADYLYEEEAKVPGVCSASGADPKQGIMPKGRQCVPPNRKTEPT